MKLEVFHFRLFPALRAYNCRFCQRKLGATLVLTFHARPNNEWEFRAECQCGADFTPEARLCHAFGPGGNMPIKNLVGRIADSGIT